ncbi:DUF7344 domain-containing protein [Natronorarus salvus]|uniref:DUF7344 domain-containing protein n=1 Tax=Natronorarus salvus TaxID=3117733 RepID=UPI002F26A10F
MELTDESPLSESGLDAIFGALATERRRSIVRCLADHGSPLTLDVLADVLASAEHSAGTERPNSEAVDEVYTSLYHVHLPKLADAGIVEYDRQGDTVSRAEHADAAIGLLHPPQTALSG